MMGPSFKSSNNPHHISESTNWEMEPRKSEAKTAALQMGGLMVFMPFMEKFVLDVLDVPGQ
jgi:hypothetical protein